MKRSDAFPSNYMSQADVLTPILVTIADVHQVTMKGDDGDERKTVMVFTDDRLKPMVLNNVNWTTCESAYGDESTMWHGKQVEIYVDPTVMFGKKRVGGLRLRIPQVFNGSNGHATTAQAAKVFTFEQATAALADAGLSKDDLVNRLKAQGHNSWNSVRDSATVAAMLAEATAPKEEEIPF